MKALFDLIRTIKGTALSQREVDAVWSVLNAAGDRIHASEDAAYVALAATHLEEEEGRVAHAYQDHLGYWTIGVGRLVDRRRGGRLTDAEIDLLLANDIRMTASSMAPWPAWQRVRDDQVRAVALLSMGFQMGTAGLAKFDDTLCLIAAGRFDDAASGMLQSLWARQTPERALRVAAMMRTGDMP